MSKFFNSLNLTSIVIRRCLYKYYSKNLNKETGGIGLQIYGKTGANKKMGKINLVKISGAKIYKKLDWVAEYKKSEEYF